ncbi:non-ribosomal peptide synthetase [Streptomyces malaysiensis]|uniref:Amino acid adenylation domain-containing protein n=1 Tax=Streptomyces malaysiensis subsp. samsunensis TaxID=459658 RepID=A0A9X2M5C6_STRMQ|nr:amino acid adenylation domain-containing protein [Streptomyces samsunensis]MCQ8835687.1 amino acid adenylation domain-containing protein [Streptomyces samsunensis]
MSTAPATAKDGSEPAPLTVATRKEQALWLLEALVPGSGVNNLSIAFQVEGSFEEWVLQETLGRLLRRHKGLRTVFHASDVGLVKRTIGPDHFSVDIEQLLVEPDSVETTLTAFVAEPFVLDGSPLLRAAHAQGDEGDVFCLAVHHIIFDTVSSTIFLEEFIAVYEAVANGLQTPAELLREQPELPPAPPKQESLDYWRDHLRGFDSAGLSLACGGDDVPDPTLRGDHIAWVLSSQAVNAVRRLQRDLRAPEAAILLAAYYLLLASHGAGPDIVVGSPADVRNRESSKAVGYHINTLPLRVRVGFEADFKQLVAKTREAYFGGIAHSDVTVDVLLSELRHGDAASWRNTVFRHLFNYLPADQSWQFEIDGMVARRLPVENGYSKFDLEFFFVSSPESITLRAAFYTDVLSRSDVQLMLERYDALLVELGEDPARPVGVFRAWSNRDAEVISTANSTAQDVTPATLLEAVARQAEGSPHSPAVIDGQRTATYGQLWHSALSTRDQLVTAGVGPGDTVALSASRCPEMAAAVLGIWLADAAYLPLDPDHPAERTAYLLEDSAAKAVLIGPRGDVPVKESIRVLPMTSVIDAPWAWEPDSLRDTPDADSCAYLIYTSGSTGKPKGTLVTHRGAANVVSYFAREFKATAEDTALWLTTFSFDLSCLELFLPLTTGGRLLVAPDEARSDGRILREVLTRHPVTLMQATPTTWGLVYDQIHDLLSGCRLLSGGEPLPSALARRLVATGCLLYNGYAPSETTIHSTSSHVRPGFKRIDIGSPMDNITAFVLDRYGRELPIGVRGELCIAGAGVALGYHGKPELTADRFREHPRHGRYYRTGDLACWLDQGTIELHGRIDRQVKLRGHRIELGEVEAVLLEHPDVRGAAVVVDGRTPGDGAVLTAFLDVADSAEGDEEGMAERLWAHARSLLPTAAVPQEFFVLESLPTTANQKVDHLALKRVAQQRRAERTHAAGTVANRGDSLVDTLTAIWRELLGRSDIDADANFFTHGGHSLLGAQLVQQVDRFGGVQLRLADLFKHPTPTMLAAYVRRLRSHAPASETSSVD